MWLIVGKYHNNIYHNFFNLSKLFKYVFFEVVEFKYATDPDVWLEFYWIQKVEYPIFSEIKCTFKSSKRSKPEELNQI